MSQVYVNETEGIETVEALMAVLVEMPSDMRISDAMGEPLIVRVLLDQDTHEESLEIG